MILQVIQWSNVIGFNSIYVFDSKNEGCDGMNLSTVLADGPKTCAWESISTRICIS